MTISRLNSGRKVFLGSVLLSLLCALATSSIACESLQERQENICGNKVTEPENSEDCDADRTASRRCGAPSTTGACRWLCDYPRGDIQCPPEWGCGLDGICRKSTGLSNAPIAIAGSGTVRLFRGDFDGDGRHDIASSGLNSTDVFFLTTEGFVERSITLPNGKGLPSVGDVNGDGISDIAIAYERSVGVLVGQESRSFVVDSRPIAYTSANTTELVPLGAYLVSNVILALGSDGMGQQTVTGLLLKDDGGYDQMPVALGVLPGKPEGVIATTGSASNNAKCAHIATEFRSFTSRLVMISSCEPGSTVPKVIADLAGTPWGGAYFADADGNGTKDVFFGDEDGGNVQLRVVRDVLTATPQAPENLVSAGTSPCDPVNPELAGPPLAIGDVNGDNYADIVDSRGVLVHDPMNPSPSAFVRKCLALKDSDPSNPMAKDISWDQAIIADFDGDGRNDVLASRKYAKQDPSQRQGTLDLWLWHSEGLVTVPIVINAPVAGFVGGDINGDSITDAAYWIEPPPTMANEPRMPSAIFVMFGNPKALPSPPQLIGRVRDIENLAIGRVLGKNAATENDSLADLLVLGAPRAMGMDKPITIIQGNNTRYPVAPLPIRDGSVGQGNGGSDLIYQVVVSDFGAAHCPPPNDPNMLSAEEDPFNVLALGDNSIWRAGCYGNASSFALDKGLNLHDHTCLFAPVDRVQLDPDAGTPLRTELALFLKTPTRTMPPDNQSGFGIGTLKYDHNKKSFSKLEDPLISLDPNIYLPNMTHYNVPYDIADVDGNGQRDVILTAQGAPPRIWIYWNGDGTTTDTSLEKGSTFWDFVPPDGDMMPMAPNVIQGIAAINLDSDIEKELAILTLNAVYLLKFKRPLLDGGVPDRNPHIAELPLAPFDSNKRKLTELGGGEALLVLDANSDGIDDLAVADVGKLLIYLGQEQAK